MGGIGILQLASCIGNAWHWRSPHKREWKHEDGVRMPAGVTLLITELQMQLMAQQDVLG
jgi:hypothetical protein